MQITIDTSKLPAGTTEAEVLATLHAGLSWILDRACEDEPLAEALYKQIPDPRRPRTEDPAKVALSMLNSGDLSYLREAGKQYGHNDRMKGWPATYTIRKKLKRLGLVKVNRYPAAHMGDVESTVCATTKLGNEVLRLARGR